MTQMSPCPWGSALRPSPRPSGLVQRGGNGPPEALALSLRGACVGSALNEQMGTAKTPGEREGVSKAQRPGHRWTRLCLSP